jgi:hypothetical protein
VTAVSVIRVEAGGAHSEGRQVAPSQGWESSLRPTRESEIAIHIERSDGTTVDRRGGYLQPRLARVIEITLSRDGELGFRVKHDSDN